MSKQLVPGKGMTESATDRVDPMTMLTLSGFVCQVDFWNHLTDGSFVKGIVAKFTYADGTNSTSNNPNVYIRLNESESLYSQDKCVKMVEIWMAVRRPSGVDEVLSGKSAPIPADKCKAHTGWGAEPALLIAADGSDASKADRPIILVNKES